MEILTKLESVFEAGSSCPGCGSLLCLKLVLQTLENLENVILVTSPDLARICAGVKVNSVNSSDPVSTGRGVAVAKPESVVIVYSSDASTRRNISSVLPATENIIIINCNSSDITSDQAAAKAVFHRMSYTATASVAYYEDFIAKIRKSLSKPGAKFLDVFAPCPVKLNYDPSNTIEIARLATETSLWPLYEIDGGVVKVTKIPPKAELVRNYMEVLKTGMQENEIQALQERLNKGWKMLNEGKLI